MAYLVTLYTRYDAAGDGTKPAELVEADFVGDFFDTQFIGFFLDGDDDHPVAVFPADAIAGIRKVPTAA